MMILPRLAVVPPIRHDYATRAFYRPNYNFGPLLTVILLQFLLMPWRTTIYTNSDKPRSLVGFWRPYLMIVLVAALTTLSGCTWYQKKQLAEFETRWIPLRDSVTIYLDSINYLPRQATTYTNLMYQDTLFFRLFDAKSVQRLELVRGEVDKANKDYYLNEGRYRAILKTAEATDLTFEQTKRYLNGVYPKEPTLTISELNDRADSLHLSLQLLKADHARLFHAIRDNFFMHKDLHNNLMKPFWDSLYAKQGQTQTLSNYPAPKL